MHLSPRDIDKLMLHNAGFLAQKRLARGLRLNYPEAVALLTTQLLELIRDGEKSVADLMDLGRRILGKRQVQPGVAHLMHEVQVEGTFLDGTKLVTVHDPIVLDDGDLTLALYGSFLPVPDASAFTQSKNLPGQKLDASKNVPGQKFDGVNAEVAPGHVTLAEGDIELYPGRARVTISVTSKGDRPIQVGSHYPFEQTNSALEFDRGVATNMHLDIPAGTAVRFEPGETRSVTLVENAETAPVPSMNPLQLAQLYERASGTLPEAP